jgi:hypothetical protein
MMHFPVRATSWQIKGSHEIGAPRRSRVEFPFPQRLFEGIAANWAPGPSLGAAGNFLRSRVALSSARLTRSL